MKNNLLILSLLFLSSGCQDFQQKTAKGSISSENAQFRIEYELSYPAGNGYGEDTPERLEKEILDAFSRYTFSYDNETIRRAYIEIKYSESSVKQISFSLNVLDSDTTVSFGSINKTYNVFDFNEMVNKAEEFFFYFGYLFTGGVRIDRAGEDYLKFTITENLIDKVYINAVGRDGVDGTCQCSYDEKTSLDKRRVCRVTAGTDGEKGADVVVLYPVALKDRLELLEIHADGGRGGWGGVCEEGGERGKDGLPGKPGRKIYRDINKLKLIELKE